MTQADQLTMGDVALKYARAGLKVFPLQGKIPFKGTQGCKEATTDEAQISKWWGAHPDANIGIATGDGLIVVDFDKLGPAQTELYLDLPAEWVVSTGKGVHVYLRVDDEVRNSAGKLLDHVDIRGEGGYVVAAASVHPDTGRRYKWKYPDRMEAKPPMAPASLLERIKRADKQVLGQPGSSQPDTTPLPEGGRNAGLASLAGTMRARGFTQGSIEAALLEENQLRCSPPLSDDEVRRIAQSISRYTPGDVPPASGNAAPRGAEGDGQVQQSLPELTVDTLKADPQLAFRRSVVAHFVQVEANDPGKWEEYKQMFRKANIGIKSVSAQMRRHALAQRPKIENAEFEDAPIRLAIPPEFRLRSEGVYKMTEDGEERILHCPLLLTKRLVDADSGEERVEISWRKDGNWRTLVIDRTNIATSQRIVALADSGLPVTSNTAAQLVQYISELESSNLDDIPLEKGLRRTGWVGAERFVPGAEQGLVFTPDGHHLKHVFTPRGTLAEWVKAIAPYREAYALLRMQMAVGFAAPLLKPLNGRNFLLHLYGPSGGAKTASMRVVTSIWGGAKLMASFHTTPYAITIHASMLNHLPVCINERQLGSRSLDKTIYSLAEGTAKLQGQKQGGLRNIADWQSVLLTNGEEPITSEMGMQGTKNRVIEIYGRPIEEEAKAAHLYDVTSELHGTAGPAYVRELISTNPQELRQKWVTMKDSMLAVSANRPGVSRNHVVSVALLALADQLSSEWIFGLSAEQAFEEAWNVGAEIIEDHLESGEDFDQGDRFYQLIVEYVSGSLGKHIARKEDLEVSLDWQGFLEQTSIAGRWRVWMQPSALSRMLADHSVDIRSVRRSLNEAGLIETQDNGSDHVTYSIRKKGQRFNVITMPEGWAPRNHSE